MAKVELKGLHIVKSNGRVYYYAWRGGPRILTGAEPGTPAFMAAYNEVIAEASTPDAKKFRSVVIDYKRRHLRFARQDHPAGLVALARPHNEPLWQSDTAQFNRPEKIRPVIRKWRDGYEATPRAADIGIQVLSRVLAHAVETGLIASNPCEGIKRLHQATRAHIIWTDEDIEALKKWCSAEIGHAVDPRHIPAFA